MNPYLQMRLDARKTQEYVAKYIEVTDQYIHRLEHGLVNTPPIEASRDLLDDLPSDYGVRIVEEITKLEPYFQGVYQLMQRIIGTTDHRFLTMDQKMRLVIVWYKAWQHKIRSVVKQHLKDAGYYTPDIKMDPEQLRKWIMTFVADSGAPVQDPDWYSLNNFCRKISLHPYTYQRWENSYKPGQKHLACPPTVQAILIQLGVDVPR